MVKTLLNAKKVVYTKIGFYNKPDWHSIFVPENEENYKKTIMDPLVNFINSFSISGIVIYFRYIHLDKTVSPKDYTSFVNRLKQEVKHKIKVGLVIHGAFYQQYSNTSSFDFTITNEALDMYYIIFTYINFCNSVTKKCGVAPIKSPNPNITSMEIITSAVTNSTMDKTKIYAVLQCTVRITRGQPLVLKKIITTYSTYCSINTTNSSLWCASPSQLSYDQAAYSKKNFKGIYLEVLDGDDFNSSCGCGQFPVTKAYISGWKSTKLTPCSRFGEIEKTNT
ncbi:uncharacterized protein LOC112599156 [Melanaphis sacchari]|uniref:uncharacterized protein LOC112599156 n=1 Tax=Melanaphis sacchari TaxID=742174 RepID=UPI000DC150B0|nr:uncharacterized protein LOC112599156 [Melanaphis sacchari]